MKDIETLKRINAMKQSPAISRVNVELKTNVSRLAMFL